MILKTAKNCIAKDIPIFPDNGENTGLTKLKRFSDVLPSVVPSISLRAEEDTCFFFPLKMVHLAPETRSKFRYVAELTQLLIAVAYG